MSAETLKHVALDGLHRELGARMGGFAGYDMPIQYSGLKPEHLATTRKYVLRHGTSTVFARVKRINRVLDIKTLSHGVDAATLAMNAIGRVELSLQKPIVADTFEQSVATGAFVLIDEATHHTVAAGMIRQAA